MKKNNRKLFVSVLFVILLAICLFVAYHSTNAFDEVDVIRRTERCAGLAFPSGSKVINFEEDTKSCIDPTWVTKIKIPNDAIETLKKQTEVYENRQPGLKKYWLSTSMKWWTPQKKVFDKWYNNYSSTASVHIVISKEKKGIFVYIECMII